MDYLVTNGYPAAAKRFAVEANIQPRADIGSIQERVEIRSAIHSGDIQTAIEKINELNPQVWKWTSYEKSSSYLFSILFCYDYTSFMHHSYTLLGVDEKHSSSVLSMNSITKCIHCLLSFWYRLSVTNIIPFRSWMKIHLSISLFSGCSLLN